MAKRVTWKDKSAYDEDGKIILCQDDNGKWEVYHKITANKMMGPGVGPWKQKKDALAYAKRLISNFNLKFNNKQEMYELNGGEINCVSLRNKSYYEGIEDNGN